MKYDFDTPVERRGTNCVKWDIPKEGELPMWVADMDFPAAAPIREALQKRLDHGVFGYNIIPDKWYSAYSSWWKARHGLKFSKENLIFCTGVIPAISSAVRKLTTPAEKVLVQTPVYNNFYNSILNNGRVVIENRLKYNGTRFDIDFDDLEEKLSDPQTTLMILCNPQNPTGNIWSRDELSKIGALCKKYGVVVLSDEIHCDVTAPGASYVPFASVNDECKYNSITCIAPTKAFNIAGIQTAAVLAFDRALYNKINRALNTDEVAEPNSFAVDAAVAAFEKCGDWLDEMREYVFQNKRAVAEFLTSELPDVTLVESEATYLLWLDCSKVFPNNVNPSEYIRRASGLFVSDGAAYGKQCDKFIRFNIACPRSQVNDALRRLKKAVDSVKIK